MKLKLKFFFSIVLIFLLSFTAVGQSPFEVNSVWSTNIKVDGPFEELILTEIEPYDYRNSAYYRIKFFSDSAFTAFNIPGCGSDCVEYRYGSYSTENNTIHLILDSVSRFKICTGKTYLNQDIGSYVWVKDEYGVRILKDLLDEPKKNYFLELGLEVPTFKSEEENDLIRRFIYLYNRLTQIVMNNNIKKFTQAQHEVHQWSTKSQFYTYSVINDERIVYSKTHVELDKRIKELLSKMKAD